MPIDTPASQARCDEVLIALRRISRAIDLQSKRLMQTCGITGPQLMVLYALNRQGSLTIGQLAQAIKLSQATVTSILDRLLRRGLIERQRSELDRRKVYISLSERGRDTLAKAPTPLQQHFISAYSELEDWEQTLILSSVQRIAHMMDVADMPVAAMLEVGELDS